MITKNCCIVCQTIAIAVIVNGVLFLYLQNQKQSSSNITFNSNTQYHDSLLIQPKQLQVIFFKTHKTASTTVGSILFRLGARHGLKILPSRTHYYRFNGVPKVDITLNHHTPKNYQFMLAHYKWLVPNGMFLSVLREPTRRYLSHYHYFVQPNDGRPLSSFLNDNTTRNNLARDFGIFSEDMLNDFIEQNFDQFFFLISEKFDETLLLLKHKWGWTLQDILYLKLNDGCGKGANFKGRIMRCSPKYENLTVEQLQQIRENNQFDIIFYERALKVTNDLLAVQPPSFWNELALFKHMLRELQFVCSLTTNNSYPELCAPYYWNDDDYERQIRKGNGWVENYPLFSVSLS